VPHPFRSFIAKWVGDHETLRERSSFLHYQTGMRGTEEIESEWSARERGWQIPEWMRDRVPKSSTSPVPKM
jgi:hypothetical protein